MLYVPRIREELRVIVVRLIEHDDNMCRNLCDQLIDVACVQESSRGIVGIRQENDPCAFVNRVQNRLRIDRVAPHGNFHKFSPSRPRGIPVHDERALAGDGFESGLKHSARDDTQQPG